jgi:ABC-type polysaccharide/polyol phosphate transport system ATPase subunit
MSLVTSVCPRVVWLEQGTVRMDDHAEAVVAAYQKAVQKREP